MFKRAGPITDPVTIWFEDRELIAQRGDTVAATLLGAGFIVFRTSAISGAPRGPFCLVGNCFDCLVEIDGEANRQACRERVREGMKVRRQEGMRDAADDNGT